MSLSFIDSVSVAALCKEYNNVRDMLARIEERLDSPEMAVGAPPPKGSYSWPADRAKERTFLLDLQASLRDLLRNSQDMAAWVRSWEKIEREDYGRSPPVPAWAKAKEQPRPSFDPACD